MTDAQPLKARIDIWPRHWARLEPCVPEVFTRFVYPLAAFGPGGPLGYTRRQTWSALCVIGDFRRHRIAGSPDIQNTRVVRLQVGRIAETIAVLRGLGYAVTLVDHREDSPRWVPCPAAKGRLTSADREAVDSLDMHRCLRLLRTDAAAVETIAAVCRTYPAARIAIAVESHELLRRFRRRFCAAFPDEILGFYTSRQKKPGRVSVGLIRQFPLGHKGEFDLLVLPYAGRHLSDETLRIATSGQYRRILSFSQHRWTGDAEFDRRSIFVASAVLPEEHPIPKTTAVMLESPGSDPGRMADALDVKLKLYWHNPKRNRRIAEVARCLAVRTKKSVQSVIATTEVCELVRKAAKTGVVILVESPVHARVLGALLPGWTVHIDCTFDVGNREKPAKGHGGRIVTELFAKENVLDEGILIRATGTKWPLELDWPWRGAEPGVIIDFSDDYNPQAARNAAARADHYRETSQALWQTDRPQART